MSMGAGFPQGKGEIGEPIASFTSYEAAQKAVSTLIAADIPARDLAIVGHSLRSVERVTGKLGYATAARSGAINGLLLGILFAAIFVLGQTDAPIQSFIGVLFIGMAIGMLLSLVAFALVRRRRDFASVTAVVADRYEVTAVARSFQRARQALHPTPNVPAQSPVVVPTGQDQSQPPRYGERIDTVPEAPLAPPQYGERVAAPVATEPEPNDEDSAR